VEAGVNTIKLFVPQIVVSIENVASNTISGSIQTVIDDEYNKITKDTRNLTSNLTSDEKVNVDCIDGICQENIEDLDLKENDIVQALISFGGLQISSEKIYRSRTSKWLSVRYCKSLYYLSKCKVFEGR